MPPERLREMIISLSAEYLIAAFRKRGYVVFENESAGYDLNLFGIRSRDLQSNTFNDQVGILYRDGGQWLLYAFPATTDPGIYWREKPMNVDGVAVLRPGQHRGSFKVGSHKGYPALVQRTPLEVYRDSDRDSNIELDPDSIQRGMFGINIHRASELRTSVRVDRWSAGCQVVADPIHFDFFMSLCRRAIRIHGNAFTYTLLAEDALGDAGDP